jgi:hypothetical protein
MKHDIDDALRGWDFKPGVVQARQVEGSDGRKLLQMRLDLGILQLEAQGRPDGTRPHGFPSYFAYLNHLHQRHKDEEPFVLDEDQCVEVDREFVQYYHRRICWLALRDFARAAADADHTLAFMNFVRDHSPSDEYTQAHEQYRGFVLFQRTQASAALALEKQDPEGAIDALQKGLDGLREFFATFGVEDQMEEDEMVQQLRKMEKSLRRTHGIEETLQEQLAHAVAKEDYEAAARIRDALRKRL